MSNFTDFVGGGGTKYITELTDLVPINSWENALNASYQTNTYNSMDNNFWNRINNQGAWLNVAVAGQYYTVCDVQGAGKLGAIFSPSAALAGTDVTVRLTVDGKERVVTATMGAARRMVMNALLSGSSEHFQLVDGLVQYVGSNQVVVEPIADAIDRGTPVVKFNKSLKVEFMISTISGQTTYQKYAGVVYELDH